MDGGFDAGSTSIRAWPRDVVRAVRTRAPDLLHTHMVHGDVYGSLAVDDATAAVRLARHNDDRYLLGPFRYVDRMLGARRAG